MLAPALFKTPFLEGGHVLNASIWNRHDMPTLQGFRL